MTNANETIRLFDAAEAEAKDIIREIRDCRDRFHKSLDTNPNGYHYQNFIEWVTMLKHRPWPRRE